jgi:hypothetical protein
MFEDHDGLCKVLLYPFRVSGEEGRSPNRNAGACSVINWRDRHLFIGEKQSIYVVAAVALRWYQQYKSGICPLFHLQILELPDSGARISMRETRQIM